MGQITKSGRDNIISPSGNSLAVFIDGATEILSLKDVRGNIQPMSDYIDNVQTLSSTSYIITNNGYELDGLDVSVNADWEWQLNAIYYTNSSPFNYSTTLCSTGKQRFDIVVLSNIGVQLFNGEESVSNPPIPNFPFESLVAITFLITDSVVSVIPTPDYELRSNKSDSYTASSSVTYASTKALVDGLSQKANLTIIVEKISSTKTLSNADIGKVILLTASCTVVLPNGLMSGFNCSFSTQVGATLTYSLGGSVVLINNAGTTMGELSSHTLVNTGIANEYLTVGL